MSEHINAANALIHGSDDDSLILGPHDPAFASKVTGLSTAIPTGFADMGWLSEDGAALALDDSVTKIKGHQGHGVVKTFIDSSETSIAATLLETKLQTLSWYLDAAVSQVKETIGSAQVDVAKVVAPSSRKVVLLSGWADFFDVSGSGAHTRIVFPHLELGARGEMNFKVGEITGYAYNLSVLGDFVIYSTAPGLIKKD